MPLLGGAVNLLFDTVTVVGYAGAMGMGYGLGRKYGRKICQFADSLESRVTSAIEASE